MKHVYDKDFTYTPVSAQGEGYLREKFERIRKEQEAVKKEQAEKVEQLPQRRKA